MYGNSEHGYIFYGLQGNHGDDLLCLRGPEVRPLFLRAPRPPRSGTLAWYYYGQYSVSLPPYPQTSGLSLDEWSLFSEKVCDDASYGLRRDTEEGVRLSSERISPRWHARDIAGKTTKLLDKIMTMAPEHALSAW